MKLLSGNTGRGSVDGSGDRGSLGGPGWAGRAFLVGCAPDLVGIAGPDELAQLLLGEAELAPPERPTPPGAGPTTPLRRPCNRDVSRQRLFAQRRLGFPARRERVPPSQSGVSTSDTRFTRAVLTDVATLERRVWLG